MERLLGAILFFGLGPELGSMGEGVAVADGEQDEREERDGSGDFEWEIVIDCRENANSRSVVFTLKG